MAFDLIQLSIGSVCVAAVVVLGIPHQVQALWRASIGLALALTVYIGLQILSIGSLAAPIWTELAQVGISGGRNSISVAPGDTASALLRVLLPLSTFIACLLIFKGDRLALRAFNILAVAGGVLTGLSLLLYILLPGTLLFGEKEYYLESFTFVFVNRNTAATTLGLLSLMLFVIVAEEWRSLDWSRLRAWVFHGARLGRAFRVRRLLTYLVLLLVVLVGLALTNSRAGVGATFVAATFFFALVAWNGGTAKVGFSRNSGTSPGVRFKRLAICLLAALAGVALLAPRVILRGEIQGAGDGRFCVVDGLLSAAADNIWTGGGFGAFTYTFNPYRDSYCGIDAVWDKAHNFYLEGVIGLGVVFVPLLIVALWFLLQTYYVGIKERRSLRNYPIAGLAGLVLVLIHSLVDFSLQIAGFAIFYATFAALTATVSLGRRTELLEADIRTPQSKSSQVRGFFFSVALVGMLLLGNILSAINIKDMYASGPTRSFARLLNAGNPIDVDALLDLIANRLPNNRLETCNTDLVRSSLTVLLAALDRIDRDKDYAKWAAVLETTERQIEHALTCMPADGNLWLRLAIVHQAGGEIPAEQARLMAISQQLSPSERSTIIARLSYWNRLTPATLAIARDVAASDIRQALIYLSAEDLRLVLSDPSKTLQSLIQDTLPLLSDARREALKTTGLGWANQ